MARRIRGGGFARSARRQTTWIGPADQAYVSVGSNASVIIASFDAASNGLLKPTIVRTRGRVSWKPTVTSATLTVVGAYGVAVVTDAAFVAGAGSVPGPFTEAGWDGWFAWGAFSFEIDVASSASKLMLESHDIVDSKGMRKVTTDETVVLVAESQIGAFDISMPLRLLAKMS